MDRHKIRLNQKRKRNNQWKTQINNQLRQEDNFQRSCKLILESEQNKIDP